MTVDNSGPEMKFYTFSWIGSYDLFHKHILGRDKSKFSGKLVEKPQQKNLVDNEISCGASSSASSSVDDTFPCRSGGSDNEMNEHSVTGWYRM